MAKKKAEVPKVNKTDTKKELFIKAYKQARMVYKACEAADISRTTFYDWKANDQAFADKISEIEDSLGDQLEEIARQKASEEPAILIFLLKTKYKNRGYVEKQEVAHSGGMQVTWEETKQYDAGK